ncbi:MAG TPA: YggS family pyridoxal phosphate-dependent enzyme, partial [Ktedonobacteraceae bacterium]|nr:YggS family pyridoxal phosphate-dependent enzyme [Ktedonobacteraceae bacterium]
VQSVDSLHLAQELQRQAEKQLAQHGKRLAVLLQVNVSGEASKEGMALAEAPEVARQIAAMPLLEIQGLMTIAPFTSTPEAVRPVFRELRLLRDRLQRDIPNCSWEHLSMGMSGDYRVAIEEGATIVRIGRAIFGERVNKASQ